MPLITLNFYTAKSGACITYKLKSGYFNYFNKQALVFAAAIILGVLCSLSTYAQIDYSFGRNSSGLRLGAGGGITQLNTHYNNNPWIACFIGTLDYEFNPYFSMGVEGQVGTLQGIDNSNPSQYFHSSTNDYLSASFNMKFGLGLVSDFRTVNKFQDAVKRLYIGIGGGLMHNNIGFTYNKGITDVYYDTNKTWGFVPIVPISIGTFIDIGNVFGYDRLEINPNIQCTYINSPYADGFRSSADSNSKGFYNMLSLTVKLKL